MTPPSGHLSSAALWVWLSPLISAAAAANDSGGGKAPGPGLGTTARCGAFSGTCPSRVNREPGSNPLYEKLEAAGGGIDFMKIG